MSLPKAVRDAAERAEKLSQQLNEGKPRNPDDGTTLASEGDKTPPGQDRDTLPKTEDKPMDRKPEDSQTPPGKDDEATYKQRYLTLKGKFDAQVPRLQQDVKSLNMTVTRLQEENTRLKVTVESKTTDPSGGSDQTIDVDAFNDYGDEFSTLARTVKRLQEENATLRSSVQNISGDFQLQKQSDSKAKSSAYMEKVVSHVASLGQEFDQLNTDRDFLNWLRQVAPGDVEPRLTKLRRAQDNMDLESTTLIFNDYMGTLNKKPSHEVKQPNIQPTPQVTGSDVAPPTSPNTRMWTRSQIKQFYSDKMRGLFKGREQDAEDIEADIHAASNEGRIRG